MINATLSVSGRMFPGDGLVGEGCACLAIDVQAPRFAPSGELIRVEKNCFDDHPVLNKLFSELLGLVAPIGPSAGKDLPV